MAFVLIRRKQSIYILLTALMSVVSLSILSTAIATPRWIDATANPRNSSNLDVSISNVNYGLFKGFLTRRLLSSPLEYDLFFTCVWGQNACAWSCQPTGTLRETEIQDLLDGKTPSFACLPYSSERNSVQFVSTLRSPDNRNERIFSNAGLWLSTLLFLALSMIALLASAILSLINCAKSPIEAYFNVHGIYVTNGVALAANVAALILYGISFNSYVKKDISIYDTIVGDFYSEAKLDYSYWILLLPCLFDVVGIFLIAMREFLINGKKGETNIDVVDDAPATGVLF
ncbi:uncharacterized protein [Venturia canescens]|uniref:uncharacterized protein n=1 Tax=Venturia canescens TaxID=32260 RepID=UPI001C9BDBAE|nr:uncharacterized protein LOC122408418 [Venturia canescens]